MAGALEGNFSGDEERIRVLRRGVDGGLATMHVVSSRQELTGTRFGAQTDVHLLIRVQTCALNISSSSGFRNEGMHGTVQCYIYICQRTAPIMLWEEKG